MRVICTLPHAGERINGVAFSRVPGGMLSDEITADQAAAFLRIPGYQAAEEPDSGAEPAKGKPGRKGG